ncbi:MAG: DUF190 domain-containing protein [Pseudomonadota bacterium]|jgi:PII-like signaling protein|nr:DUF190 domain-containing protein [Xanthomonadaceae bacterium]MDE2247711.1 DUF190 domain-containing protein [Xanthomonadaceae bacterium]MDE3210938.1 DUF190 domain-containing protein [Pseudomonadota bacterium]
MTRETLQQGVNLHFYCHLRARHDGMLVSDWLLTKARQHGIGGGSAFRAIACFGRHGVLHEEQFFELTDDLTIKVEFLLREEQAEQLLQVVREAGVDVVYARSPTSFAATSAS